MAASLLIALVILTAGAADQEPLKLHVVHTSVRSYRLLAMSRDDDGFIWAGSIHQAIHRYDSRAGDIVTVPLPVKSAASSCICVGKKVYVLGQSYPRLIVYDRSTKKFTEKEYPSPRPDVWYGTLAGRFLYVFDRAGGVVKWDTDTDTAKLITYPYKTPFPSSAQYEPSDQALWCRVWDMTGAQYVPVGLARLDLNKDEFTGFYAFPTSDTGLAEYGDAKASFFLPYSLKGKLVPFDFKEKRWCRSIAVPRFGELFGFIGGPVAHRGRLYFSLSTYNGTDVGCDGKPYHFCNAILEFDPKSGRFDFPTLEAKDGYYQIAYTLSSGGEFFATGTNIREPDGSLNGSRAGEVVFWQSRRAWAR